MKRLILALIVCVAAACPTIWVDAKETPPVNGTVHAVMPTERIVWRQRLAKRRLPGTGCFRIKFPSEVWERVPCGVPSTHAKTRANKSLRDPSVAGSGNDVVATAVGGTISSVIGSFSPTTDILTVQSVFSDEPSQQDAYSIQINPQLFALPTSVCASSKHPTNCTGWLQFVFDSDQNSSSVYMEYWIFDFGVSCPGDGGIPQLPGLTGGHWAHPKGGTTDCYYNTAPSTAPSQDIAELGQLQMLAGSEGSDSVVVILPDGTGIAAALPDSIFNFSTKWQSVEFNVFGIYNGARAHFNVNAAIVAHLVVNNATTNAPLLTNDGFTGETNTLNIQLPGCASGGNAPSVSFAEFLGNYKPSKTCPPAIAYNLTPLTLCQSATIGVSAAQQALAKAQARLTTPTCQGSFRLECVKAVNADQQALNAAIINKNKVCHS